LGNEHPETLWSMNYLTMSYLESGRFDDSVDLFETVVDGLGEEHHETRNSIEWLEIARQRQREGISMGQTELNANVALTSSAIENDGDPYGGKEANLAI